MAIGWPSLFNKIIKCISSAAQTPSSLVFDSLGADKYLISIKIKLS